MTPTRPMRNASCVSSALPTLRCEGFDADFLDISRPLFPCQLWPQSDYSRQNWQPISSTSTELASPSFYRPVPELHQGMAIGRDGVIPTVSADDLFEPFPLLTDRLVHPLTQFLLDLLELCQHAVSPGLPMNQETAPTGFSADEGKAQEVDVRCQGSRRDCDFFLNRDGSLSGAPQVKHTASGPHFQVAAESAVRAVRRCTPLKLPADKYELWQDVVVTFDPRIMQ
jgi:hypothetical protein